MTTEDTEAHDATPATEPLALKSNEGLGAWGRDDLMAIAAVRYCLGRMTYITSDCSEWLVAQWPNIKPSARAVIQRDIDEAFQRDDEARANGDEYKPLGWDCDRGAWAKVRALWQAPNVEFSGVPAGHSSNHPAGGTSAGTQG